MSDLEPRAAIVREARRCVGTPYHHQARLIGIGLDCATLLKVVFEAAGVRANVELPEYSPQWHLHRDEPHYIEFLRKNGCREITTPSGIGDIAVYKQARQFAHGAIIVELEPLRIVHAYQPSGYVLEGGVIEFGHLSGVAKRFFTAW